MHDEKLLSESNELAEEGRVKLHGKIITCPNEYALGVFLMTILCKLL